MVGYNPNLCTITNVMLPERKNSSTTDHVCIVSKLVFRVIACMCVDCIYVVCFSDWVSIIYVHLNRTQCPSQRSCTQTNPLFVSSFHICSDVCLCKFRLAYPDEYDKNVCALTCG